MRAIKGGVVRRGPGWFGHSKEHSKAAREGWLKRKRYGTYKQVARRTLKKANLSRKSPTATGALKLIEQTGGLEYKNMKQDKSRATAVIKRRGIPMRLSTEVVDEDTAGHLYYGIQRDPKTKKRYRESEIEVPGGKKNDVPFVRELLHEKAHALEYLHRGASREKERDKESALRLRISEGYRKKPVDTDTSKLDEEYSKIPSERRADHYTDRKMRQLAGRTGRQAKVKYPEIWENQEKSRYSRRRGDEK